MLISAEGARSQPATKPHAQLWGGGGGGCAGPWQYFTLKESIDAYGL